MARKCPNCGGPAPMVSWVGKPPDCPACQGQTVVNTDYIFTSPGECPYGNDHSNYLGPCPECGLSMNPSAEELFDTNETDS